MTQAEQFLNQLLKEKDIQFKNGLYHFTQCSFSYNSNKIEGTCLTEEQTAQIYETKTISFSKSTDSIKIDDILEIINHFRLFDFMLDNAHKKLDKKMILKMHSILKHGTTDELDPIYNVGGFKVKPNIIGVISAIPTSLPEDVENDIDELLIQYDTIKNKTIEDIIEFHWKFESIHPFSDGNGRVGRMILFKECLANDIVPFIILNEDKEYYLRGLREYSKDRRYLIDTCLSEQDTFDSICEQLQVYEMSI